LTLRHGSAVSRGNERENVNGFGLRVYLCLFAKGVFCHLPSENAGQFEREKQISFLIALITSLALKEREQRKQQDSRSFCHRRVRFLAANPLSKLYHLRCWY